MEMTADSNNLQDFFAMYGLKKSNLEKLKVCLRSNMWEKRAFRSLFNIEKKKKD